MSSPAKKSWSKPIEIPDDVVTALVDRIAQAGGLPFVTLKSNKVLRALYNNATEEQMRLTGEFEKARMAQMDAYIGVRGAENSTELSDVPDDKMKLFRTLWSNPVHSRDARPKHQMDRAALADPGDGAAGGHEHRSIRRLITSMSARSITPSSTP